MEDYYLLVSGLEYRVRKLISEKNLLKLRVEEMEKQIVSLQEEKAVMKDEIKYLKNRNHQLTISTAIKSGKETKEVKLLINEYLKEIDKTIAYLNNIQE